jgi:hypothetical protein
MKLAKSIVIKDLPVSKQAVGAEDQGEDWPSVGHNATLGSQFGLAPIDETCTNSQFNKLDLLVLDTLDYSQKPIVLNADDNLTIVTAVGTAIFKVKHNAMGRR